MFINKRKKISIIVFFITIVLLFQSKCFAETIKYKDYKDKEYLYYDVNTYNELYSVYEELNNDYEKALDEITNLENQLENKSHEMEEIRDYLEITDNENIIEKIDSITYNKKKFQRKNNFYFYFVFASLVVIFVLIIYICILKEDNKNKKI